MVSSGMDLLCLNKLEVESDQEEKNKKQTEALNEPHERHLSIFTHSQTESQQGTDHNASEDQLVQSCYQYDGEVLREEEQHQ